MSRPACAPLRLLGSRRGVGALAAILLISVPGSVAPAHAAAASGPPASQSLVVLLHDRVARSRPDVRASRVETVAARRPLTRVRTVLPVLSRTTSGDGRSWFQVRLPGRPNQHTGWIPTTHTRRTATGWHISVDLSARRVTVSRNGRTERRFRAVVGTSATPTPRGAFFVEEALRLSAQDAGGPFALATSARSEVLQEFNGGPGQIALHGTNHLSDPLGSAASHGCVRLSTRAISWVAARIGAGVPLTVTR